MLDTRTQRIREEAKRLLEAGEVHVVIGYEEGSTPARTTPAFVKTPEDVDRLFFSPACSANLAHYLREAVKGGRAAIVAKSCDAASIVTLLQEKQIRREDVFIIGVPCAGTLDTARLAAAGVDEGAIRSVELTDSGVIVHAEEGQKEVPAQQSLKSACLFCQRPQPSLFDVLVGDPVTNITVADLPGIPEGMQERMQYWAAQFERCIRCYACRQVCPACYCTECFADRMAPGWVGKKIQSPENWMYHTTRAMHMAGRCVQCGECERVCPVQIPIQHMMRELAGEVEDLFAFRAGEDPEAEPVLATYRDNDEGPAG